MKLRSNYLTLALAITGIILSGCLQQSQTPECPTCPNPSPWSECTEQGVKTRTNYKCSAETNYSCAPYNETKTCLTEINIKGRTLEAVVSPTADETVKGIIKIEATKVPGGTNVVAFILAPQAEFGQQFKPDAPNVQTVRDTQASDGWKGLLDTTKVDNGLYTVFAGASYEGAPDSNPWLDYASTQVVVKN